MAGACGKRMFCGKSPNNLPRCCTNLYCCQGWGRAPTVRTPPQLWWAQCSRSGHSNGCIMDSPCCLSCISPVTYDMQHLFVRHPVVSEALPPRPFSSRQRNLFLFLFSCSNSGAGVLPKISAKSCRHSSNHFHDRYLCEYN